VVSEIHVFGSEKGEGEGFCEKYNETSGIRGMLLAEQTLYIEETLLSVYLAG
jgi:hypothetical protein